MSTKKIFPLILLAIFLYCWIKFYAFYQVAAQGPFGSSQKGDFLFYVELFAGFIPIALFTASIYASFRVSKNNRQRNSLKLLLALIFFAVAAGSGVFSVEEYAAGDSFTYLIYHYEDWRFFLDNFLLENLVLFFISGLLFIYKLLSHFLWRSK